MLTGAVGALLTAGGMNVWLVVVIMLAIGVFQAYWIAYVRVPSFITTLVGILIFRGLSNVVLNGRTQSISNQAFKDIFGGGGSTSCASWHRTVQCGHRGGDHVLHRQAQPV